MTTVADVQREETFKVPPGSFTINSELFVLDDDVVSWAPAEFPVLEPADEDLTYVIDRVIRPEQIARAFYGNPRLFWVIAQANGIRNPLTGFRPGITLRIPAPDRVITLLEQGSPL